MAFFFATADDLLPVLVSIEAKMAIVYTPFGASTKPTVGHYRTARELPTLFDRQPFESAVNGPAYLVTEAGTQVVVRQMPHYEGKDQWSVDQLSNPASTVLRHGGLFKQNILLHGEVRTVHNSASALRIQRAFDAEIRKRFAKIQSFYVGPAAEDLLEAGCRLTAAEQCPPKLDLRR